MTARPLTHSDDAESASSRKARLIFQLSDLSRANPMSATIFIDGEASTTGLQIRDKLKGVSGLRLASLPPEARKDAAAKQKLYGDVDVVILCLPDEAAKEAARLIDAMGGGGVDPSTSPFSLPHLSPSASPHHLPPLLPPLPPPSPPPPPPPSRQLIAEIRKLSYA